METTAATTATPYDNKTRNPPLIMPENDRRASSLLEAASLVVSASVELEEIALHFEYLPPCARQILLRSMDDMRLRCLERLLASDSLSSICSLATHECEFQAAWRRRCHAQSLLVDTPISSDTLFREPNAQHASDARRVFWEHHFRSVLSTEPAGDARIVTPGGEFVDSVPRPDLALYTDVVVSLRVNARELVPRNVSWLLQLQWLQRIELHHPAEHRKDTVAHGLESLLTHAPALQEVGFFHGRLSSSLLQRIASAIAKRQHLIASGKQRLLPVRCVEFVSVKLKGKQDHCALVEFFAHANVPLESVRISSVIADFQNRRLADGLLASRHLSYLSLEHNDLEDDVFMGFLCASQPSRPHENKPIALRHLRLGSNAISSKTMQILSTSTLDGVLALQRLELRNNQHIGDAGIHALAPMLSSGVSLLTHLDIRNCHVGLEGALTLLSALEENATLTSLDMSQNFFGSSVGDFLADFLLSNHTLQRLHLNYVGLGLAACTERLLLALRTNQSLSVLSVGANRLRDLGAARVMEAVAVRSRVVPYEALDLSGNLITVDGLHELHRLLEHSPCNDEGDDGDEGDARPSKRQRVRDLGMDDLQAKPSLIGGLGLLNNDFLGTGEAAARTRAVLDALKQFVGKVHSNEWSSRRNVYDDEV